MTNPNLVVLISDIHATPDTNAGTYTLPWELRSIARHFTALAPSAILDLGDTQQAESDATHTLAYKDNFYDLVTPTPLVVRGNHEQNVGSTDPVSYSFWDGYFPSVPYHVTYDWTGPKIRFILFHASQHMADGYQPNFGISNDELTWIEGQIAGMGAGYRAVLGCHPPLWGNGTGSGHTGYVDRTLNGQALIDYIDANPGKVLAHIGGHHHWDMNSEVHGQCVYVWGPSTALHVDGSIAFVGFEWDGANTVTMRSRWSDAGSYYALRDSTVFVPIALDVTPPVPGNATITGISQSQTLGTLTGAGKATASVTGISQSQTTGTLAGAGKATATATGISQTQTLATLTADGGGTHVPGNATITGISQSQTLATLKAYGVTSIMERALAAYNARGWQQLGAIAGGEQWRESDIQYIPSLSEYYQFGTSPTDTSTNYRHSATLEGLPGATATALSGGVTSYYPTVAYNTDTGRWYVFGTEPTTGGETWLRYSDGLPTMVDQHVVARGKLASFYTAIPIIDSQVRKNPIDSKWYMVGLHNVNTTTCAFIIRLNYSWPMAPDGTYWQLASAGTWASPTDIFANIGRPAWASYTVADPNLMFMADGRCYLYFTGWNDTAENGGTMTVGMVEISTTTYMAIGSVVVVGDSTHPGWHDRPPTDASLVVCADGIERIVAGQQEYLGALDLPKGAQGFATITGISQSQTLGTLVASGGAGHIPGTATITGISQSQSLGTLAGKGKATKAISGISQSQSLATLVATGGGPHIPGTATITGISQTQTLGTLAGAGRGRVLIGGIRQVQTLATLSSPNGQHTGRVSVRVTVKTSVGLGVTLRSTVGTSVTPRSTVGMAVDAKNAVGGEVASNNTVGVEVNTT